MPVFWLNEWPEQKGMNQWNNRVDERTKEREKKF